MRVDHFPIFIALGRDSARFSQLLELALLLVVLPRQPSPRRRHCAMNALQLNAYGAVLERHALRKVFLRYNTGPVFTVFLGGTWKPQNIVISVESP
jgi:hypothetical protein